MAHGFLIVRQLLGILAAAGQAGGILLSRPMMARDADPIAASVVRVAIAAVALTSVHEFSNWGIQRDHSAWTTEVISKTLGSSVIDMGVGMTLVMFALQGGRGGIVSTLSSAAPFFILPVLWVISARRLGVGAWVDEIIVFFGTALVFIEVDALNLCNLYTNLRLFRLWKQRPNASFLSYGGGHTHSLSRHNSCWLKWWVPTKYW